MKNSNILFIVLILSIVISSCASNPNIVKVVVEDRKIYAVLFKAFINETGEVKYCDIDEVIDLSTKKNDPNIIVSTEYRDAVKRIVISEKWPPKIENGKPVVFFFFYFIDPIEPYKIFDYDENKKIFKHITTAKLPGKSMASSQLQSEAMNVVMALDRAQDNNVCKQRKMINTEVTEHPINISKDPWTEKWTIDRCGNNAYYRIIFTPTPKTEGVKISISVWK